MKKTFLISALGLTLDAFLPSGLSTLSAQDSIAAVLPGEKTPNVSDLSGADQPTMTNEGPLWPHENSELKPDPSVYWGRLSNGFRFVIMPNQHSDNRASIRLLLNAGSLMEADGQEGLAHFLEHMAFNGTRHSNGGKTIEQFQRLGIGFGAHANAQTEQHRTVYSIDLPTVDRHVLDQTFLWFRDVMDGMLLDPSEIDKERGVILSELDARNTGEFRSLVSLLEFGAEGGSLSRKLPVGTRASIDSINAEWLKQFYEKTYRPDNAILVVVGDVDALDVDELVRTHFTNLTVATSQRDVKVSQLWEDVAAANLIPWKSEPRCRVFVEPELGCTSIYMGIIAQHLTSPDSIERQTEQLKQIIVSRMLNSRLSALARTEDSPLISCAANISESLNLMNEFSIRATIKPEKGTESICLLEQLVRSAVMLGFEDDEYQAEVAELTAIFETMAAGARTRENADIASSLVESLSKQLVFSSPAQDAELAKQILASLTKEDCRIELATLWGSNSPCLFVSGPSLKSIGAESADKAAATFVAAYNTSTEIPVSHQKRETLKTFAYDNFGPVGTVVERTAVADLDITQARFANNVRLNVKSTKFEEDVINVTARFGHGLRETPAEKPGLPIMAQAIMISGGLGRYDLSQVDEFLRANQCSLQFRVEDESFVLEGTSTEKNLSVLMRAIAAYLTDPGYRPMAMQKFRSQIDGLYQSMDNTTSGLEATAVVRYLRGGDRRFGFPSREDLEAVSLEEVREWMSEPMSRGDLEVSIVGDVRIDAAIESVASTLGALPVRATSNSRVVSDLRPQLPAADKDRQWTFKSNSPTGAVYNVWNTNEANDIHRRRRIRLVQLIFEDRLRVRVREDLGVVYSPSVEMYPGDTYSGYSYLATAMATEAGKMDTVSRVVTETGLEMPRVEISDDEFQRAFKPFLAALKEQSTTNRYWLDVLAGSQRKPELLEQERTMFLEYESMTRKDVQEEIRRIFTETEPLVITLVPEPAN